MQCGCAYALAEYPKRRPRHDSTIARPKSTLPGFHPECDRSHRIRHGMPFADKVSAPSSLLPAVNIESASGHFPAVARSMRCQRSAPSLTRSAVTDKQTRYGVCIRKMQHATDGAMEPMKQLVFLQHLRTARILRSRNHSDGKRHLRSPLFLSFDEGSCNEPGID